MSIRGHFNEIETTRASAIFSYFESQKRAERWLQSDFFVYLPSPKKYKMQLVSTFFKPQIPATAHTQQA